MDWLTGFESDGRLSGYVRDKPLVEEGWAEGKGLASGHCVVWVVGCWLVGLLVGWLVDWLTGFESDGRLSDYMSEDDGKTD